MVSSDKQTKEHFGLLYLNFIFKSICSSYEPLKRCNQSNKKGFLASRDFVKVP